MYLLFDIGGTHMRFAVSQGKKLDHIMVLPTPKDFNSAISLFKKSAAGISGKKILKVVGGVPRFSGDKLSFWISHPTQKELQKITKSKVELANDAALGALGEAVYGAGKNFKINAFLTFSTGLGGARINNKKIDANSFGFEPTLQITQFDPKKKTDTPIRLFTTGRGIKNRYEKDPERIKNKKVWSEIEIWMKVAVNNAAVFWSPDCIILGGAIAGNKNISVERIQKFLNDRFANMPFCPEVKKADLGQLSGLYGALALAKQS